jgi:hypothetical protein
MKIKPYRKFPIALIILSAAAVFIDHVIVLFVIVNAYGLAGENLTNCIGKCLAELNRDQLISKLSVLITYAGVVLIVIGLLILMSRNHKYSNKK